MNILNYNIKQIIIDIITFKISVKSIKTLFSINKLVYKIENNKFNIKDIKKFKPSDIRIALKFHNKYIVNGEKYNVEYVLNKLQACIAKLNMLRNKNPELNDVITDFIKRRIFKNKF